MHLVHFSCLQQQNPLSLQFCSSTRFVILQSQEVIANTSTIDPSALHNIGKSAVCGCDLAFAQSDPICGAC
jgi:hypothetical protein